MQTTEPISANNHLKFFSCHYYVLCDNLIIQTDHGMEVPRALKEIYAINKLKE